MTNRSVLAGDGIAYAGSKLEGASLDQDHPHCCWDGRVYLGFTYPGEDGEEYEAYEAIPCRRCADEEE